MTAFLPVSEPLLDGNEKKYLADCVDSGWISSEGPYVDRFEKSVASFVGVRHGVSVSSRTAALETALYALGIGPGDEVIIPSFTIISCAVACLRLGAKPVLVDIDPETWSMDVSAIEAKLTSNTKAVMAVHMYGHPVDMDPLLRLRARHGFLVVEDAAQAHGAEYSSKDHGAAWLKCGTMGDIAATSFYANKIVSSGEGGMVLSDSEDYARRARSYRNLCHDPVRRFRHSDLGSNFRLSNLSGTVYPAGVPVLSQDSNDRLGSLPGIEREHSA